jgi:hypothetical protein
MYFNPKKVAFSRHESFVLRFGWLTKGFRAFEDDPNIFTNEDAVVTLGVGKNMVNSIRHWLRASKLIIWEPDTKEVTSIGRAIFSKEGGWDPFLEDEATIWLIHWLIATNPEQATAWYWYFNHFHKPEFTSMEVAAALSTFAKERVDSKFATTSIKQDAAVLLRTYVQSKNSNKIAYEDVLDSPLSLLKLISYSPSAKTYQSKLEARNNLPIGIFGYAICDFLKNLNVSQVPIEDLIYCKENSIAPGLIFKLTESSLLSKLEQLIQLFPDYFAIDQTAGIHQFFVLNEIDNLDTFEMLKFHYEPKSKFEAA